MKRQQICTESESEPFFHAETQCVTHEMGFAREVSDRVIFMNEGQILEAEPPEEFFHHPKSERARLFLSQIIH